MYWSGAIPELTEPPQPPPSLLRRMNLRIMKYSCTNFHIPRKTLCAADTQTRNPRKQPYENNEFEKTVDHCIQMISNKLSASSNKLKEFF